MPKRRQILYTPQNAAKNHFVELGGWPVEEEAQEDLETHSLFEQ